MKFLSLQQPFAITRRSMLSIRQTCARRFKNLQAELGEFQRSLNIQNVFWIQWEEVVTNGILCLSQTVHLGKLPWPLALEQDTTIKIQPIIIMRPGTGMAEIHIKHD